MNSPSVHLGAVDYSVLVLYIAFVICMNVNLAWGAVLFIFGALMWSSAVRSKGQ